MIINVENSCAAFVFVFKLWYIPFRNRKKIIERSKEQHLFDIEIKLNMSLLNKSNIIFLNLTYPNIYIVLCIYIIKIFKSDIIH